MPENTVRINETITMAVPEGFQRMTPEELKKLYQDGNPDRWGVWDKERHTMIAVSWERYPALLSALADLKAVARRNQQLTEKGYAGHAYRFRGFFSLKPEDVQLEGYRFSYRVDSVSQCAETVLLKCRKTIFSITCAGREENADADSQMFRQVLGTLRIG